MAGSVNRGTLLLIFHRCWRNGIDNVFPFRNTCFANFENVRVEATLERLGRWERLRWERKGWKLKGESGFIGFAINEKWGGGR